VKADLHIPDMLIVTAPQDNLRGVMIPLGRDKELAAILDIEIHKMVKALVAVVIIPEYGRFGVFLGVHLLEQLERAGPFNMEVHLSLGQTLNEIRQILVGLIKHGCLLFLGMGD